MRYLGLNQSIKRLYNNHIIGVDAVAGFINENKAIGDAHRAEDARALLTCCFHREIAVVIGE